MISSLIFSTLVLVGCCLRGVLSGNVTITSTLPTGREYVCPGENVTYVCNGTGSDIELYAPPRVCSFERFTFTRGDSLGPRPGINSVIPNLISTDEPLMIASVAIEGSSSTQHCTVHCEVHLPTQKTVMECTVSDIPTPINVRLVIVTFFNGTFFNGSTSDDHFVDVTWMPTVGQYDLRYYTVTLFVNGSEIETVRRSEECVRIYVPLPPIQEPFVISVYVGLTTTSMCDQTSTEVFTDPIPYSVGNAGVTLEYMLMLLVSAVTVTLAIV